MLKLFFIIIFNLLLLKGLVSQDIYQTLALADHFKQMEMHDLASKYYRRVIFFGNDSIQTITYPKIAESMLFSGNYAESIFFYTLASNTTFSDSLRIEYSFYRVLGNLLMDNFDHARQQLLSISQTNNEYFTRKTHFYHGVLAIKSKDSEGAKCHFILAATDSVQALTVASLFEETNLSRPNPKTAKMLSIFMPGLGQAYSGDTRGALNSFILIAGLGTLSIYTASNYSFFDGALSILPWMTRYYLGGIQHA